jgi:endonuclease-3 related protein
MIKNSLNPIIFIYNQLFRFYGPQGWWPLLRLKTVQISKTGSTPGYHPMNYDIPETHLDQFEIIIGSILAQNTTWTSADRALRNLNDLDVIQPEKLLIIDYDVLKEAIRCAGFLNQKSQYLKNISQFFLSLDGRIPTRSEILKVKGVGNETADSILLYAYKKPEFVVDSYTKRILLNLELIKEKTSYMDVKKLFEDNLPIRVPIYQEYHALLVEHAKRFYKKKPYTDPLRNSLILNRD